MDMIERQYVVNKIQRHVKPLLIPTPEGTLSPHGSDHLPNLEEPCLTRGSWYLQSRQQTPANKGEEAGSTAAVDRGQRDPV